MGGVVAKIATTVGKAILPEAIGQVGNAIGGNQLLAVAPNHASASGGGNSLLSASPNHQRDASGGGRNWSGLSAHFAEDVEAMDQASQQGTVSPDEWHSFYTCLYRLVTTVHDPGHDQGLTSAIHELAQALHGTEHDEFTSEDAINAAQKFMQEHIGLHILAFLSIIDEGTGLDFSADPEVEETLKSGNEFLSQAEDQLDEQDDGHDHGQWHGEEEHDQQGYDQGQQGYDQGQQGYDQGQQSYDQGQQSYDQGQQSYDQGQQSYDQGEHGYDQGEHGYDQGEHDPNDPATQHQPIAMY